jgi:hypothetical protein
MQAYTQLMQSPLLRDMPVGHRQLACLDLFFGWQERMTCIDGETTYVQNGVGRREFLTHWADTVVDDWALPIYSDHGYTPVSSSPPSLDVWHDRCNVCGQELRNARECPRNCLPCLPTPMAQQRSVRWKPKYEPEQNIIDEGCSHLIDEYQARYLRRNTPTTPQPRAMPMTDGRRLTQCTILSSLGGTTS